MLLLPGIAGAKTSASGPANVKILGPSQQQILPRGKLRVRVRTKRAGFLVLVARSRNRGTRKIPKIAKPRKVKLGAGEKRVLKLRLTRFGRKRVANCAAKALIVKLRFKAAGATQRAKRGKAKSRRGLHRNSAACRSVGAPGGGSPAPVPGGGGGGAGGGGGGGNPPGEDFNVIPPATPYTGAPVDTSNPDRCDYLDGAICLQPWPNNYFTEEDADFETGRHVNLNILSMPQNAPLGLGLDAKPIDPADHNRADGFSPGNLIVTKVPGLETQQAFENTGAVSIDRPDLYDDPDQPVVVINAATGERHPVWAEIDSNPTDPAEVNLIIRPLVNFDEGARYVVALRNLRDENGDAIEAPDAFRVFRDNLTTGDPVIDEDRRPEMEKLFQILGDSQVRRSELYLAWDFTVASERSLSSRMLSIRDRAFAGLGDTNLADGVVEANSNSPAFNVDSVTDFTPAQNGQIARQVEGTVTVPCFLTANCAAAGAQFALAPGPYGEPVQAGTTTANFICRIPRDPQTGEIATGVRPSLYGHGLLGSAGEVGSGNVSAMAFEQQMMMCATDWYGFATQNIANILAILQDLSLFPLLVDGSQQGFLHFLFLGRAMIHEDGFADNAAFQDGGNSVIDTSELYYDGNSQGGILGGSLVAVAPDFKRAVLGVPGMNYSTLLRRSVDFEPYAEGQFGSAIGGAAEDAICDQAGNIPQPDLAAAVAALCLTGVGTLPDDTPLGLYDNYPDELERPLILSLIQMLWDRGEANGYAQHMTADPLPNTPPHEVLLHAAFGDHQVANVTAEVEARTIGASVYQPALDPGRHWEADGSAEIFGIPAIGSFPFGGSALVYWDGGPLSFAGGTETPPNGNVPPRTTDGFGADPHSYPRNDVKARAQKGAFLSPDGTVRNPCTTTNNVASPAFPIPFETGTPIPCRSHGWLGGP